MSPLRGALPGPKRVNAGLGEDTESPGACLALPRWFKDLQVREWEEHGKRGAGGGGVVGAEAEVSSDPQAGIRGGGV